MTSTVPVHSSQSAAQQVLSLDWFGRPARHRSTFSLTFDNGVLRYRFEADKPPQCDESYQLGDFVEGLWDQDVAELFVMGPDGSYQEINLSPQGAWWCALFSGYRRRVGELACPSAKVSAGRDGATWYSQITLAIEDLPVLAQGGLERARLNVTAILDPDQPEYLCYGHQLGGEPDFHLATCFLPVTLIR